jgi:hypothetical protein
VSDASPLRALARLCGTFHNVAYYAPEMKAFKAAGVPKYWRAYMAYRSAPMGTVPPPVVVATFYNFAPARVAEAIPSVWDEISPSNAIALCDESVDRALRRVLGDDIAGSEIAAAATLAARAMEGCDVVGRPLFAAHTSLPWPEPAHMRLYQACTLWREHRGDGHNVALAAAEIDGLECHVLLSGTNRLVNASVIEKIRGWTIPEWEAATQRLTARGLLDGDGAWTAPGRELRDAIEAHTDRLAAEPLERLGRDQADELIEALSPIVARLVDAGAVAASWPPKSFQK